MTIIRTPRRPSCFASVWNSVDEQLVGCVHYGQEVADGAGDDQSRITFVTKTVRCLMAFEASVVPLFYLSSEQIDCLS
ncbi:hypothetical protein SAMN04515647_1822 [Cohaesibacter sp. ES.047]|nr:hypothetical protein SAMN04515647_1822 [Cohaesibacter sp. ES.047]